MKFWEKQSNPYQLLQMLSDLMPCILYIYNVQEHTSVHSNYKGMQSIGYSQEDVEAIGPEFVFKLCHPDDIPNLVRGFTAVQSLKDGEIYENEFRMKHKDGHWVWLKDRTMVFSRTPDGRTKEIMGTTIDASKGIQTEKALELEKMKVFQAAKMASLGEMAAGIAHELNNPLAIIHGYAERLRQDPNRAEEFADKIIHTSERIASIIRGLRNFSRDGVNDDFSHQSLLRILLDTYELCRMKMKNKNIEIRLPDESEDVYVLCKAVQISQVLLNLFSNSYDAIQEQQKPWIQVSFESHKDKILIKVEDSGNGISKEVQEKMMDPFFTTKSLNHGTGLGLSISHSLIRSHRGDLYYDANQKHTTFMIELPKPCGGV